MQELSTPELGPMIVRQWLDSVCDKPAGLFILARAFNDGWVIAGLHYPACIVFEVEPGEFVTTNPETLENDIYNPDAPDKQPRLRLVSGNRGRARVALQPAMIRAVDPCPTTEHTVDFLTPFGPDRVTVEV